MGAETFARWAARMAGIRRRLMRAVESRPHLRVKDAVIACYLYNSVNSRILHR